MLQLPDYDIVLMSVPCVMCVGCVSQEKRISKDAKEADVALFETCKKLLKNFTSIDPGEYTRFTYRSVPKFWTH
jgi:hypothetical protein